MSWECVIPEKAIEDVKTDKKSAKRVEKYEPESPCGRRHRCQSEHRAFDQRKREGGRSHSGK